MNPFGRDVANINEVLFLQVTLPRCSRSGGRRSGMEFYAVAPMTGRTFQLYRLSDSFPPKHQLTN